MNTMNYLVEPMARYQHSSLTIHDYDGSLIGHALVTAEHVENNRITIPFVRDGYLAEVRCGSESVVFNQVVQPVVVGDDITFIGYTPIKTSHEPSNNWWWHRGAKS